MRSKPPPTRYLTYVQGVICSRPALGPHPDCFIWKVYPLATKCPGRNDISVLPHEALSLPGRLLSPPGAMNQSQKPRSCASPFHIRRANLRDLDAVTEIALIAMPMDPQWAWRFPKRQMFPEDHLWQTRQK